MSDSDQSRLWNAARGKVLSVHFLGLVDFESAVALQTQIALDLRDRDDQSGVCLVCEHPPTVTMGRDASWTDILCDSDELLARQLNVRWLGRGGGALIHSPGHVAFYPLLPLDRLGVSVSTYRDRLGEVACRMLYEQRLSAEVSLDTGAIQIRTGQVGQIGLAMRSGISRHGLFLNVSNSPRYFQLIDAGGGRQTSIAADRARPISGSAIRESLVRHLANTMGYERVHHFTGHPLLKRTTKVVANA